MRAGRIALVVGPPIPTVLVRFDGIAAFAGVDTGSETTIISPGLATILGYDLVHPVREVRLTGVGVSPAVPVVSIGRVELSAFRRTREIGRARRRGRVGAR